MSTERRFDSIPRADSQNQAALLSVGNKFDGYAMSQGERADHNPFDPRILANTLSADLRLRLDGSRCKPYERLAVRMLEAHLAARGIKMTRKDAARADVTIMLPRDLDFVQATPHETLYPTLKSRVNVPVSTEAPPGAQTITYRELTHYGEAALLANGAKDVPRVDVSRTETTVNVRTIACAYGYTVEDLEHAAMAGLPLPAWKARAAALAMEQLTDQLLFAGNAAAGLIGFNTIAGVAITPVVTGAWIATPATGAQVLGDLAALTAAGITAQADVEGWEFDSLLLPSAEYEWCSVTPMAAALDVRTSILDVIKIRYPGVTVGKWNRLATAGAAGVTRAIIYRKNPLFCQGHIPREMTPLVPQLEAFETVVYNYARIGGVECQAPLSLRWMDGI